MASTRCRTRRARQLRSTPSTPSRGCDGRGGQRLAVPFPVNGRIFDPTGPGPVTLEVTTDPAQQRATLDWDPCRSRRRSRAVSPADEGPSGAVPDRLRADAARRPAGAAGRRDVRVHARRHRRLQPHHELRPPGAAERLHAADRPDRGRAVVRPRGAHRQARLGRLERQHPGRPLRHPARRRPARRDRRDDLHRPGAAAARQPELRRPRRRHERQLHRFGGRADPHAGLDGADRARARRSPASRARRSRCAGRRRPTTSASSATRCSATTSRRGR